MSGRTTGPSGGTTIPPLFRTTTPKWSRHGPEVEVRGNVVPSILDLHRARPPGSLGAPALPPRGSADRGRRPGGRRVPRLPLGRGRSRLPGGAADPGRGAALRRRRTASDPVGVGGARPPAGRRLRVGDPARGAEAG